MQDVRTIILAAGFFLIVFIGIGLWSVYNARPEYQRKKAKAEAYYSKYAILLKGVIIDKQPVNKEILPDNYFMHTVKISESNTSEHDLRDYREDYYLLIKNDTAKYVSHSQSSGEIGDSIIVNYKTMKQFIWSDPEKYSIYDLPVF